MGVGFSEGEGVLGKVIKEKQILSFSPEEYMEITKDHPTEAKLWGKPGFVVAIPMLFKGNLKGGVALYDVKMDQFQMEVKKEYLQGLANQIAVFLETARLYELVIRDRLTGLYVHSFMEEEMHILIKQAKRYNFPFSFIMMDVDKFKHINDEYGHAAGNELLKAMSQKMLSISRSADLLSRFGGDEFEFLLPHTDKEKAVLGAERFRKSIEGTEIDLGNGTKIHVTVSMGVASFPEDAETIPQLQAAADEALYRAKAKGRNCVST